MTLPWSLSIVAVVVVAAGLRIMLRQLPLRAASRMSAGRMTTLGLGLLGLTAHCTVMFFTDAARSVPGSGGYVDRVNAMGAASMGLYAAPAVLVVAGLGAVARWVLAAIVALLALVGLTMYDGGPVKVHLTAILLVVVALAATMAALIGTQQDRDVRP